MTKTNIRYEDYEKIIKEANQFFEKMIKEDFKNKTGLDLDNFSTRESEIAFVKQLSKVKFN